MTTSAELVNRVRRNINEPAENQDPLRSDPEIAQWLTDALYDYVSKIHADSVPELVVHSTFTGSYWSITSDYIKLLHVVIDHTISGSTTATEQAFVLDIDNESMALYMPAVMGAWCSFDRNDTGGHVIKCGPNCYQGTVTYIGLPSSVASCNTTFPLDMEHEEPIVNYATHQALAKVNDEDAPRYMERYNERVAAELNQKYPRKRKVEKVDPA